MPRVGDLERNKVQRTIIPRIQYGRDWMSKNTGEPEKRFCDCFCVLENMGVGCEGVTPPPLRSVLSFL